MLTPDKVVPYLLEHKLVGPEGIVDGNITVVNISRRNLNYKVISERGPSYVIKQGVDEERVRTVSHESHVYELLASIDNSDLLVPFLPHYVAYDPQACILILELINDSLSLVDHHRRCGRFSAAIAGQLGIALATLHRLTGTKHAHNEYRQRFLSSLPFVLCLNRPDMEVFRNLSNANIELIKIVQQSPKLSAFLDQMREKWKEETLIHNDLRWDNCRIYAKKSSGKRKGIKLVDWELAGYGDPCWDVGTFFSEYLDFWILSAPIVKGLSPKRFCAFTQAPLEKMHAALNSFWEAYAQHMGLEGERREQCLLRSIQYAGARLIQTAFDRLQLAAQFTDQAVYRLQLSHNILTKPLETSLVLLRIPV